MVRSSEDSYSLFKKEYACTSVMCVWYNTGQRHRSSHERFDCNLLLLLYYYATTRLNAGNPVINHAQLLDFAWDWIPNGPKQEARLSSVLSV